MRLQHFPSCVAAFRELVRTIDPHAGGCRVPRITHCGPPVGQSPGHCRIPDRQTLIVAVQYLLVRPARESAGGGLQQLDRRAVTGQGPDCLPY